MKRTSQKPIITRRTFERLENPHGLKLRCLTCGVLTPVKRHNVWPKPIMTPAEIKAIKEQNREFEFMAMTEHEQECKGKAA